MPLFRYKIKIASPPMEDYIEAESKEAAREELEDHPHSDDIVLIEEEQLE